MTTERETASGDSGATSAPRHVPVLLEEMLHHMTPAAGARMIDGTFGAGGYARALLAAAPGLQVLAIDRDPEALAAGSRLVTEAGSRLILAAGRFGDMADIADANGFRPADGVVLDIGVSSMQVDEAARGFSFMVDGPLDMRMERTGTSAADIVNGCSEAELADLIFGFGEERQSRRIARAIIRARDTRPIETTTQLAALVERAIGGRRDDGRHPATLTFQALRIAANDELGELARGLEAAEAILSPGGRLVVITFHSLEDRIVKRFLARRAGRASAGSRHGPPIVAPERLPSFHLVNPRPVTPSEAEVGRNPRSRSAKLRSAMRTGAAVWPSEPLAEMGIPGVAVPFRRTG